MQIIRIKYMTVVVGNCRYDTQMIPTSKIILQENKYTPRIIVIYKKKKDYLR